jgi:aromatic ring-opening dioxygenase catalytic subunit (LigB family)
MAEIVAGFGVPHTPMFPELVEREGPQCETAQLYRAVAEHLEAVQPDVLVVFDSDHLNTFFFNNLPTFCVGIAEQTDGPNDTNAKIPHYVVPVAESLGRELHRTGTHQGFDLAQTQEFRVDHSILVPLHFLTPRMQIPIVPVFINGVVAPLPGARRCLALGQLVRSLVEAWPGKERVALLASGSFSLEVSGPRSGLTDYDWMNTILDAMRRARTRHLVQEATEERMLAAGNVSGELLNWIALLGAVGRRRPRFMEPQMSHGHAYGVWRWD